MSPAFIVYVKVKTPDGPDRYAPVKVSELELLQNGPAACWDLLRKRVAEAVNVS
jgi:hypothetical protein